MKRMILIVLVLIAASLACETISPHPVDIYEPVLPDVEIPTNTAEPEISPSATNTPEALEPTEEGEDKVAGLWQGTAQWLCDENPVWQISLEFQSGGMVHATITSELDTTTSTVPYALTGDSIQIDFKANPWIGEVSGDSITGTFESPDCQGVWSVTRN